MHSNFITPPDYVETVVILNATEQQVTDLSATIKAIQIPYTVYFYNDDMNDTAWLSKVSSKADVILDAKITNLEEYFNK
jgi:hypothetical protein